MCATCAGVSPRGASAEFAGTPAGRVTRLVEATGGVASPSLSSSEDDSDSKITRVGSLTELVQTRRVPPLSSFAHRTDEPHFPRELKPFGPTSGRAVAGTPGGVLLIFQDDTSPRLHRLDAPTRDATSPRGADEETPTPDVDRHSGRRRVVVPCPHGNGPEPRPREAPMRPLDVEGTQGPARVAIAFKGDAIRIITVASIHCQFYYPRLRIINLYSFRSITIMTNPTAPPSLPIPRAFQVRNDASASASSGRARLGGSQPPADISRPKILSPPFGAFPDQSWGQLER